MQRQPTHKEAPKKTVCAARRRRCGLVCGTKRDPRPNSQCPEDEAAATSSGSTARRGLTFLSTNLEHFAGQHFAGRTVLFVHIKLGRQPGRQPVEQAVSCQKGRVPDRLGDGKRRWKIGSWQAACPGRLMLPPIAPIAHFSRKWALSRLRRAIPCGHGQAVPGALLRAVPVPDSGVREADFCEMPVLPRQTAGAGVTGGVFPAEDTNDPSARARRGLARLTLGSCSAERGPGSSGYWI